MEEKKEWYISALTTDVLIVSLIENTLLHRARSAYGLTSHQLCKASEFEGIIIEELRDVLNFLLLACEEGTDENLGVKRAVGRLLDKQSDRDILISDLCSLLGCDPSNREVMSPPFGDYKFVETAVECIASDLQLLTRAKEKDQ